MEVFYGSSIDGGLITLEGDEAAHCVRVLRHRVADQINVIDGRGTLYRCRIETADPHACTARIEEAVPGFGSHPYRLTMAVCPTKNTDRYEWFAEKATEIGVDVIAPVIGERSERKVLKTDRLERLVLSAAKQSLKGAVPRVSAPVNVRDFLKGTPADALRLICYCFDDAPKLTVADAVRTHASSGEIFILIGPEGDFSPAEAQLARSLGWLPVTLGPSRLRTETAAVVAAAQVYTELTWKR